MLCKNLMQELETGGLEERFSAAAQAHLDECAQCSGLVADLKAMVTASRPLAETDPPARLWVSLRNQLESEGIIRELAAAQTAAGSRTTVRPWFRPALAGAYLAILLVATTTLLSLREVELPQVAVPAAIEPAVGEPEVSERNPVVAASYTRSLETIDNFIRLCEKTVREQPGNETAREYLYDAYQQKAGLLAMTMERGAWGD